MQNNRQKLPLLTQKEVDVLEQLVQGCGKHEIARRLNIAERTVDRHIAAVAKKLSSLAPGLADSQKEYSGRLILIAHTYRQYYQGDITSDQKVNAVRRRDIRYTINIKKDHVIIDANMQIECLFDTLEYVSHGMILDDRSPRADGSHQHLSVTSNTEGLKVTHYRIINDAKKTRFRVHFEPPLKKGDVVEYQYHIKSANYFPMSMEEIQRRIVEGDYHLKERVCEANYTISTYADSISFRLNFPDQFEIANPYVYVEVGHDGERVPEEEKRIHDLGALSKSYFGKKVSLEFRLRQPRFNHRYRIRWQPLGFIVA